MNENSNSALPAAFANALELQLARFLAAREADSHLVMPQGCLDHLATVNADGKYSASVDLNGVNSRCDHIFIFDSEDEPTIVEDAKRSFPDKRIVSVQEELIPILACRTGQVRARLFTKRPEVDCDRTRKYAVVCGPRTGSTFLCDALTQAGAGRPMEHLRGGLAQVLRTKSFDREMIYRRVFQNGAENGVFGTKLISHFLTFAFGTAGVAPFLEYLVSRGFSLIFLRRSLIEQAVSNYVASATNVWHVRGKMTQDAHAKFESVPYNFDDIFTTFHELASQENVIEKALAGLDPRRVHRLSFQDLIVDPHATVSECRQFIGLPASGKPIQLNTETIRVSKSVGAMREMVFRFERDLAIDKE